MEKKRICYFEITLLVLSIIAFSFIISETLPTVSAGSLADAYNNRTRQGGDVGYNENFADTSNKVCCIETVKGAKCQDIAPGVEGICDGDALPTPCSEVSQCQIGTCLDPEEGLCTTKAPQGICLDDGGEWFDDPNANVPQCERGCCVMGSDVEYVTEQRCNYLSFLGGYSKDFRDYQTELDCIALKETQDYGACVLNTGGCSFGTELECLEIGGIFKEDMLCSNPSLNTGCEAQASIGCAEGFDEIYWYDSCGNRENIYSSDKGSSWNNGNVLDKSESCNPTSGNVNSESCGNCNNMLSSICSSSSDASGKKVKDGNFVCRDLRCIDEDGEYRENGESWCVYDSYIGDGKDTVGSRHWKRYCEDGVVKSEGCADYRNELCAEESIINDAGKNVSLALCRTNRWKSCLSINNINEQEYGETRENFCNEDSDCKWSYYRLGDNDIKLCLPNYPEGLNLRKENMSETEKEASLSSMEICGIASQTCKVYYIKKPFGDWECAANCECEEESYTQKMNEFCTNLGDCGAYINYEGELTQGGYTINGRGKKLGEGYLSNLGRFFNKNNATISPDRMEVYDLNSTGGVSIGGGATQPEFFESWNQQRKTWIWVPFIGWIVIIVVEIARFIVGIFTEGDKKVIQVKFECLPWQAPLQEQNCDICNKDPLKPCTEYRCSSLGTSCELLNKDSKYPICDEKGKDDFDPPRIESIASGDLISSISEREINIKYNSEKGCIPAFTPIVFSLNTNEPAECRYSLYSDAELENMDSNFVEGNYFVYNHTFAGMLPSMSSLPLNQTSGEVRDKIGNLTYYVKCQDKRGNYNSNSYEISMCVSQDPDKNPPELIATLPRTESYVPYGKNETQAKFYFNEPVDCNYDFEDNLYSEMINNISCNNEIQNVTNFGWECSTNLKLEKEQTDIFIKCLDQPWLPSENLSQRNVNLESFKYSLKKSQSNLTITEVKPDSKIINGFEPISIKVTAKTSGGAEDGKAICSYKFVNKSWAGRFRNTNSDTHEQLLNNMIKGEYNVEVNCEDSAGNLAKTQTNFKLDLDLSPPLIVRAYNEGSSIKFITNEEAKCYYDFNICNFEKNESQNQISSSLSTRHTLTWDKTKKYHIKCEDLWGNTNPSCAIILRPGE